MIRLTVYNLPYWMTQFTVTHHGTSTYQHHRVTTMLDDSVQ